MSSPAILEARALKRHFVTKKPIFGAPTVVRAVDGVDLVEALEGATAFLHARNLNDSEYETWGYYYGENYYTPAAGRNFVAGVDYDF